MNFENFNDYLLSINIAQFCRENGFKKVGSSSLYLLTNILKAIIKRQAEAAKNIAENANRSEVNMIDYLLVSRMHKEDYVKFLKAKSVKSVKTKFCKRSYIGKLIYNQQLERDKFIEKINMNNYMNNKEIKPMLNSLIPDSVKYYPSEFTIKESELKLPKEEIKKLQQNIKIEEHKEVEDIILSNNYFENLSKKHKRKNSVEINNVINEININVDYKLGGKLCVLMKNNTDKDANLD